LANLAYYGWSPLLLQNKIEKVKKRKRKRKRKIIGFGPFFRLLNVPELAPTPRRLSGQQFRAMSHPYMAESGVYSSLCNMLKIGKVNLKTPRGKIWSPNQHKCEFGKIPGVVQCSPQWFPSGSPAVP
jgi:hypothetical protein